MIRNQNSQAQTKRTFLLGAGISRSFSPVILNAAFKKLRIRAKYELQDLQSNELPRFLQAMKGSNDILGFNVTMPFKEVFMKFLSSVEPRSQSIGAINTVKMNNGRMYGFNTDYDGVVATLHLLKMNNNYNRTVNAVVLGAGGASRACVYALLRNGCTEVTILNRTLAKAQRIKREFAKQFPKAILHTTTLTSQNISESLHNCSLIINAVSDSGPNHFPVDLDLSKADTKTRVFDLGYTGDSLFLNESRRFRLQSADGLLMLVVQAAKSFEIWTGRKAPMRTMTLEARKLQDR